MIQRVAILLGAFFCISTCVCGQTKLRAVHVFVALADNNHQGIIPVPPVLGNGDDPARNLYWDAAFGVRTFFRKSHEWQETFRVQRPYKAVLERSVFRHRSQNVVIVADAYRGSEIKLALMDFLSAAARIPLHPGEGAVCAIDGIMDCPPEDSDVVVYIGFDGLMDFSLAMDFAGRSRSSRFAIILACASKSFFRDLLKSSGATPLLWTNKLMAPEAYTLKAALDGWIQQESKEEIRKRAAAAYAQYQECSNTAAMGSSRQIGELYFDSRAWL